MQYYIYWRSYCYFGKNVNKLYKLDLLILYKNICLFRKANNFDLSGCSI